MKEDISSIDDLLESSSFTRWVNGRSMSAEAKAWDRWIREAPAHRDMARHAQQQILGIDFLADEIPAADCQQDWEALQGRIGNAPVIRNNSYRPSSRSKMYWIFRIAAVLLIVATTGFAAHLHLKESIAGSNEAEVIEWKTIETEYRQQKTISLSDGSTITLNANSSITYPVGWVSENATEVYLEGEAYFSVTSRREHKQPPFRVITNDGTIEVMGTKFVIANSERDTRVGLEEGEIIIKKDNNGEGLEGTLEGTEQYMMKPGQVAHLTNKSNIVEITDFPNIHVLTSWIDQEIVLESSPLSYLTYRIEQTFGVEVIVSDKQLYERRLTGKLKLRELDHLVKSISEVMGVDVSLDDGTVYFGKSKHIKTGGSKS